ncbi:MAG: hypothetical protein AAF085_14750, partial [Planctomycetota bacterium]
SRNMPRPLGVLVYSIDAKLPTGFNPAIVYPREDKVNAAFHAGDVFDHDDAPLRLRVIKKFDDDSYAIEVAVK